MKFLTTILLSSTLAFSLNVQEIVQKSDAIRNVGGSMYERNLRSGVENTPLKNII